MKQSGLKVQLMAALLQLCFIALACVLGYALSRHMLIIPKAILRLPAVHVSHSDLWSMLQIFVVVFVLQILASGLVHKTQAFSSLRRFGMEYLWYLFAYTTASLYCFLATTINYDPQFVAAIGLISSLLYLATMSLVCLARDGVGLWAAIWGSISAVLRRLVTMPGVVALIYFLLPLALGMAFAVDRDIANRITQLRIWFNPSPASEWGLKNVYPGVTFEQPVLVRKAPGDEVNLYVLERVGRIYRLPYPEGGNKELVLDINDSLGEVEVENGALGFAFHPRFGKAGEPRYIYVFYTDTRPADGQINRLSRFDLASPDLAARQASEIPLLVLPREGSGFHNGGSVEFGPDGYLYVGIGEGVHPKNRDARTSAEVLRAGVVRLDVDELPENLAPEAFDWGEAQRYRVPVDNPFIGRTDIRNEYWALGLRNPFRFSFDPLTGDLWLGDVGSTVWEEVNRIEPGMHYQFPVSEGYSLTGRSGWESLELPEQGPVYTYEHNAYDRAVIGGVVYRGNRYPSLRGKYVFADNYSAKIFVIPADQPRVDKALVIARARQYAQRGVSSLVQLTSGEILVTTLGAASEPSGELLMLVRAAEADAVVQTAETAAPTTEVYDEQASAASFAVNCARCHGVSGDGEGPDSALLGVAMPDFTSPQYQSSRTEDEIRAVIELGGAAQGMSPLMPPWGEFLQAREIDNLVIYLQSLPARHHKH